MPNDLTPLLIILGGISSVVLLFLPLVWRPWRHPAPDPRRRSMHWR